MRHVHIITFRGTIDLGRWNMLLRFLYDSGISYVNETRLSPTKEGAGNVKYYERVGFVTGMDIHFDFKK